MERNPNHPVTNAMRDQWHKLCAIALWLSGKTELNITAKDIEDFQESELKNIVVHPQADVITLRLVSDEEGKRLALKEGGLPS